MLTKPNDMFISFDGEFSRNFYVLDPREKFIFYNFAVFKSI